jgi:hypothetical protein
MEPMKKKWTAIAVTVGVGIAAVSAAAALTYELNRPLHLAGATSQLATPVSPAPAAFIQAVSGPAPMLYVPTITVVGRQRPWVVGARRAAVDISEMRCADWRALDMGSGRVQVCE